MGIAPALRIFKPTTASLGYALFFAVNATSVWGGVFPFLPVAFQTHDILMAFFLAQTGVYTLSFVASAIGVYFLPGPTRQFFVRIASAPYAIGWFCVIVAMYIPEVALVLVMIGGGLIGLGSAGFYMLWQRIFASKESDDGTRDLLAGTVWAAILYFALYAIPRAVNALLIPLVMLPLFGLAVSIQSRTITLTQPMFEDIPREHPLVYRRLLSDYWKSALAVGLIGFCAGIMRSLAIADVETGNLVNVLSMVSMFVAVGALGCAWYFRSIHLRVTSIYRVAFPFMITAFLLLPLLPSEYGRWMAAIIYAIYGAAVVLVMVQCAQISRDRGVNPVFVYGFFGTIVYALHGIGFITGAFAEGVRVMGVSPIAMAALVAVYLLALMHFIGAGGFGRNSADTGVIEFLGLRGSEESSTTTSGTPRTTISEEPRTATSLETKEDNPADTPLLPEDNIDESLPSSPVDMLSLQVGLVQKEYRLSAREAEIMELVAKGHTVARIAEMLVISENTVRTHTKRIYTKLDVHKKQELVDVLEQATNHNK